MQVEPAQLFYEFRLDDHVPADHLLRRIDRFLDLASVRSELRPFYSAIGRPSIDPELMMRMLLVGYSMGIRSERRLCEEVHLNLAYRWFCRLGLEGKSFSSRPLFCFAFTQRTSSSTPSATVTDAFCACAVPIRFFVLIVFLRDFRVFEFVVSIAFAICRTPKSECRLHSPHYLQDHSHRLFRSRSNLHQEICDQL